MDDTWNQSESTATPMNFNSEISSEPKLPDPLSEPELPPPPSPLPPPLQTSIKPVKKGGFFGAFVLYAILFAVGFGASILVKQYYPEAKLPDLPNLPLINVAITPLPTFEIVPTSGAPIWKTYQVISGVTKQSITGFEFFLPEDVLSPICDNLNCASQGTYLPGGTRFTVAARGKGQLLPDFRGTQISEVGGKIFTQQNTTIAGRSAVEFTANFNGQTVSGYNFTRMRGYMIALDDISFEINHFTPTGLTADFENDDKLFDQIIARLNLGAASETTKGGQ